MNATTVVSCMLIWACMTPRAIAEELLFSFSPVPDNAALSKRSFAKDEVLIVTIVRMAPGETLYLERCGNARCSIGAPVLTWTFDDFAQHSPAEVNAEGDRYGFLIFNADKGLVRTDKGIVSPVVGAEATVEHGVTTLRFSSGTILTVTVRSSR